MNFLHAINPLYSLSGFVVGVLVGMTGVGGGSLMTPLLILVFGIHPSTAVGTDLLYAAATKTVGTAVHGANRTVDWGIVARLAAGSVPATAVTLLAMAYYGKQLGSVHGVITTVLGVALILTAAAIFFRNSIVAYFAKRAGPANPRRTTWLTILLGAVLGALVSLSSVGAGALGMTVLLVVYPRVPVGKLVGSDIAHAVPLTLLAGLGHWLMGSVNWQLLISLLSGSIPGIIIGSLLSARAPDKVLRSVLGSTLGLVGVKMFF
jgi:uncharacterized membrane protein YfcA